MTGDLRIGELARASGLTPSALRFYDAAGVLVPAAVDPVTGYRRYAPGQVRAARVLAGLRRTGLPVARLAALMAELDDAGAVRAALDAHLRELADDLAGARRAADVVHRLLTADDAAGPTRARVAGAELAAAVAAVRFAVGTGPELPALTGALLELDGGTARLVATDRYRLAVAELAAVLDGPGGTALLPAGLLDAARALLGDGPATVTVDGGSVSLGAVGAELTGTPLPHDFPDWRGVVSERRTPGIAVDGARLRRALEAAPPGSSGTGRSPSSPRTAPSRVRPRPAASAWTASSCCRRSTPAGRASWPSSSTGRCARSPCAAPAGRRSRCSCRSGSECRPGSGPGWRRRPSRSWARRRWRSAPPGRRPVPAPGRRRWCSARPCCRAWCSPSPVGRWPTGWAPGGCWPPGTWPCWPWPSRWPSRRTGPDPCRPYWSPRRSPSAWSTPPRCPPPGCCRGCCCSCPRCWCRCWPATGAGRRRRRAWSRARSRPARSSSPWPSSPGAPPAVRDPPRSPDWPPPRPGWSRWPPS